MARLCAWSCFATAALVLGACSAGDGEATAKAKVESNEKNSPLPPSVLKPGFLAARPIGLPVTGRPSVTHLAVADLDEDGRLDVIVCDAQSNTVSWIRQMSALEFEEATLAEQMLAPAHASVMDFDGDGDLDVLVACMGVVFPSNALIGSVVVLENDGRCTFTPRVILEGTDRVTDVRGFDADRDGDYDLVAGQFGYEFGAIRLLRQTAPWTFETEILLGLSGTIHTPVGDFTGNGSPDVAAIVSQEWEEVHLFVNEAGKFRDQVVWGSTNEDYGSSGMEAVDLDRDGDLDLLVTNGDGFDYARPGPRPWHGVQWLENRGNGFFKTWRVGELAGAYSPVAIDLDEDGDLDIVVTSGFNDWSSGSAVSLMCFENAAGRQWIPRPLAQEPTHLIVAAKGDFDGDGVEELVTGGFHTYPPWEKMSRVMLWTKAK